MTENPPAGAGDVRAEEPTPDRRGPAGASVSDHATEGAFLPVRVTAASSGRSPGRCRGRTTRSGLPLGPVAAGRTLPAYAYLALRETERLRAAVAAGDLEMLRVLAETAKRPTVRARALLALGKADSLDDLARSRRRGAAVARALLARLAPPSLPSHERS